MGSLCPCPLPRSALNAAVTSLPRAAPCRWLRSMVRSRTFAKPFFSSTLLYSTSVMPFLPMKGSSLRMADGQHSPRHAKRDCAPDRAILPCWSCCTSTVTCPSSSAHVQAHARRSVTPWHGAASTGPKKKVYLPRARSRGRASCFPPSRQASPWQRTSAPPPAEGPKAASTPLLFTFYLPGTFLRGAKCTFTTLE